MLSLAQTGVDTHHPHSLSVFPLDARRRPCAWEQVGNNSTRAAVTSEVRPNGQLLWRRGTLALAWFAGKQRQRLAAMGLQDVGSLSFRSHEEAADLSSGAQSP
jgi:hypothetical protein